MTAWNPNTPVLQGLEWFPVVTQDDVLNSDAACFAQRLRSTAAETIGELRVNLPRVITPGRYLLEVYPAGSEVPGVLSTSTFRPNEDTNALNVENEVAAVVNLWQSVDEAVLNTADYIRTQTPPTIFGHLWTFKLNTAAWPAGRRVTAMRWVSIGRQLSGQHEWEWALRRQTSGFLRLLRTAYAAEAGQFMATAYLGDVNPFTGMPWTTTEVQSLDSLVDPVRLSLRHGWANPADATSEARLFQTYLEVDWVAENRVAVGAIDVAAPGYAVVPMFQPDGTANWPKAAATTYTYVLRRIPQLGSPSDPQAGPLGASVGSVGWRYHDDENVGLPSSTFGEAFAPALATNGTILDLGPALTRGRSLVQRTTAPAASADGIYGEMLPTFPNSPPTVRQQITTGVAQTYDAAMFVVGYADPDNPPTGNLTVRCRRQSDNVQFGGNAVLTPAEFDALDKSSQGWARVLTTFAAPAVLAAATQYYLEFEAAEPVGTGWQVAYGAFPVVPNNFGTASFAGLTDALRPHFAGAPLGQLDAWAMLVNQPAQIAGLISPPIFAPLPGDGDNCSVDGYYYVGLDWTTSVEANFGYYEVQRSIDGGTTWEVIAYIYDQAHSHFEDAEGPRNVAATYRVRQTQYPLAIPGPWSSLAIASPDSLGCEVLFVSNAQPALNVGYDDQTPRTYEFLDADRAVLYPIFGRDRQVALQPIERLGDRWSMEVIVNAVATPTPEGRRLFDAIEAIARADIPHVTVLDSDGNRWIGLLQVPEGTRREPGKLYLARVTVTETATTPTPVVIP